MLCLPGIANGFSLGRTNAEPPKIALLELPKSMFWEGRLNAAVVLGVEKLGGPGVLANSSEP